MNTIKKILLAVDLTEDLPDAAEYTAWLAKHFDAEVTVLNVTPNAAHFSGFIISPDYTKDFVKQLEVGAEKAMAEFLPKYFTGVEVHGVVVQGDPAEEIMAYANKNNVDLIIMANHGRKGLDRLLLGSVAQRVTKHASQPLLTIKPAPK
jgi:nucleotide-binding universal stress UspA family protein